MLMIASSPLKTNYIIMKTMDIIVTPHQVLLTIFNTFPSITMTKFVHIKVEAGMVLLARSPL